MMCIRWSTHAWGDFMESNRWGFRFVETDIASFEARTKHMGTASLLPALLPSTEPREAIRLLRDARTHLFNAWQSNSDDFSTLRQLGVCNFELAQRIEKRWQEKRSAAAAGSMRLSSSGQRRLQDSSNSETDSVTSLGDGDGSEAETSTILKRHDLSATPTHVPRQRYQVKTEEQKEIQMLAEQAVDNFKKAATIRPEDSMIRVQLGLAHVMRARCRAQRQEDFYLAAQIFEERLAQGNTGLVLERVLYPALQSRGEELSGFLRMLYHSTPLVLFFARHMGPATVVDDGESRPSRTMTEGVADAIAVWESQQLTELKLSQSTRSTDSTTRSKPAAAAPELQQSGDKAFWGLLKEEQKRDAAQQQTTTVGPKTNNGGGGGDDDVGWCLDFAESGEVLTDPAVLTLQSLFDNTPRHRLHGLAIASMSFAGCDLLTDTSLASLFRFLRRTQHDADQALTTAASASAAVANHIDAPQLGSSASVGKQKRSSEKPNKKQAALNKTAVADHNAEPQRTARVFPEEVDLAMCNITDATLLQIAGGGGGEADETSSSSSPVNNHRLRRIRLDGCRTVTGGAIAALLARCPNLEKLAARDCPAIAWSKKTVTQALKQATQLRVLDVRGSDVSEKWVQATKKNSTQLSILHSL
ncbi:uncharacterized protein ACA1_350490 [Acanthamoeba castellanii str. Neff]|uniref:Leucine rich repeat domain containing protein n=1 Tax=Acanthamoeba castellanii (strain ATCC 30010 / Neff) TaxID=1257118 RepID=L8HJ33_ACACF|nr:uncharacterized protein ACA1_350490 [Acanthamoeba castellanii str. Neff]ELR25594.1 hypothetical protein ACA1_350490 [Acanthamoeba castellanii str. Neff]